MKTIIKFPIYVEIDTENVDRKVVTEAANAYLYPRLIEWLSSKRIAYRHLREFRKLTGQEDASIKLFTDGDLFRKSEK